MKTETHTGVLTIIKNVKKNGGGIDSIRTMIIIVISFLLKGVPMPNSTQKKALAKQPKSNGNGNGKAASTLKTNKALLAWHRQHEGIYARVARSLGVDASYVSRVASGQRQSDKIERALVSELERIQRLRP
jgi:hypothetical protein